MIDPVFSSALAGANERARLQLFRRSPICYWCGRRTMLEPCLSGSKEQPLASTATVEHVDSRTMSLDHRLVLACHECNQLRATLALKFRMGGAYSKQFKAKLAVVIPLWRQQMRVEMLEMIYEALMAT